MSRQKEVFSNKALKCNMDFLEANVEDVRNIIRENKTYKQIREILSEAFPEVRRGFSERNLRLFCTKHRIKKLTEVQVDEMTSLT